MERRTFITIKGLDPNITTRELIDYIEQLGLRSLEVFDSAAIEMEASADNYQQIAGTMSEAIQAIEGLSGCEPGKLASAVEEFSAQERAELDVASEEYHTSFYAPRSRECFLVFTRVAMNSSTGHYASGTIKKEFKFGVDWVKPKESKPYEFDC